MASSSGSRWTSSWPWAAVRQHPASGLAWAARRKTRWASPDAQGSAGAMMPMARSPASMTRATAGGAM
eukprot:10902502-Alexandrium_andersonii.AAC.1